MTDFPGFPTNDFTFHFAEIGPALAGLIVRDVSGNPRAGLLPSRPDLVRTRPDLFLDVSPFVAVRSKGRAVLIGGTTDAQLPAIAAAPSANARLDVLWTRPADVEAGDPIVPVQVTTGTAAAVPSEPAIPAEAIKLGTLRMPAGATGTSGGTWTPAFPQTCLAGGVIPFRTNAERNAFGGLPGQLACVDGIYSRRVGSSWVEIQMAAGGEDSLNLQLNNGIGTVTVPLPTGMFKNAPAITLDSRATLAATEATSFRVSGRTATSFTVEARRAGLAQITAWPFAWNAIGT